MKKIHVGVIGAGYRGRQLIQDLRDDPDADVAAVCDRDPERLTEYGKAGCTVCTDYRELLRERRVDAVIVASPDDTHGRICEEALKAGKHILCEKPLDVSGDKILRVLRTARTQGKGRVFSVGYPLRYARLFSRVREYIDAGVIGRVINIQAVDCISYGGYAFFHGWQRCRRRVTSLLLQKATHTLDLMDWFAGSRPVRVAALGGLEVFGRPGAVRQFGGEAPSGLRCSECERKNTCEESLFTIERFRGVVPNKGVPDCCVYDSEVDVDDNQALLIRYASHAAATYMLNEFSPDYKRQFFIFGDKGRMEFNDADNRIEIRFRDHRETVDCVIPRAASHHDGGDQRMLEDFLHCCRTGGVPRSSLTEGAVSALLALAAQKSIDSGNFEEVPFDPEI